MVPLTSASDELRGPTKPSNWFLRVSRLAIPIETGPSPEMRRSRYKGTTLPSRSLTEVGGRSYSIKVVQHLMFRVWRHTYERLGRHVDGLQVDVLRRARKGDSQAVHVPASERTGCILCEMVSSLIA